MELTSEKLKSDFINKITERMQVYEKDRIIRFSKLVIRELFVFCVLFFLIKCFMICLDDFDASFLFGVMICSVIYYSYYDITHSNKLFKQFIKSKCDSIISDLIYHDCYPLSSNILNRSNLFGYFQDVNVDDGFRGSYNTVEYRILEALLTAKSPKGFDIKIFKGLIVLFEFNKKILKDTIITRKREDNIRQNLHGLNIKRFMIPFSSIILFMIISLSFYNSKFDIQAFKFACMVLLPGFFFIILILVLPTYILHIIQQRKKPMTDTHMEDIVFNKDYVVHTNDNVEARYLITTSFIERFMKLQKIFKTKNIKCSFFDNKIMIAIPAGKDLFELCSLFVPLSSTIYINRFYDELSEILKVIDILKLNIRTGL